jgi:hypothetical protein
VAKWGNIRVANAGSRCIYLTLYKCRDYGIEVFTGFFLQRRGSCGSLKGKEMYDSGGRGCLHPVGWTNVVLECHALLVSEQY